MAAIAALIEIRERSKQVEKTVGGAAEGSNSVRDVRGTFAMDLLDEHGRLPWGGHAGVVEADVSGSPAPRFARECGTRGQPEATAFRNP